MRVRRRSPGLFLLVCVALLTVHGTVASLPHTMHATGPGEVGDHHCARPMGECSNHLERAGRSVPLPRCLVCQVASATSAVRVFAIFTAVPEPSGHPPTFPSRLFSSLRRWTLPCLRAPPSPV